MKYLLILLFIFSFNGLAEIRYVSKTGSSTVPYTSWATACDSIQKCINICSSGDTIYVANGVYTERVEMIQGLTLLGSGLDSCIIDARNLVFTQSKGYAVLFSGDCIFSGFSIWGGSWNFTGILGDHKNYFRKGIISDNKVLNFGSGIAMLDSTWDVNLNSIIRDNLLIGDTGLNIFMSQSLIENNVIIGIKEGLCLRLGLNCACTIKNNYMIQTKDYASILTATFSYGNDFYNNIFIGKYKEVYATTVSIDYYNTFNNNFVYGGSSAIWSITEANTVKNNIFTGTFEEAIFEISQGEIKYNVAWDSPSIGISDTTNKYVYPMVVDLLTDQHLQKYSPLIDAGDPSILDIDGTRSDIGPYGGPYGENYNYKDLSPAVPKGLIAMKDTLGVRIKWKKNYETDFKQFLLYRDTIENFTPSESNLAGTFTDTTYAHSAPYYPIKYYYKIKSEDNQGNISQSSEQIAIVLTDLNEENPQVIQDYKLYQNYPNPFNPNTIISYRLKEQGYVKLYVYDMKGELVSTLVNEVQPAGYYEREFSGKAATDISDLASGVYIYRIEVIGNNNILVFSEMKKMMLLK